MPAVIQVCLPLGIYSIPIRFNLETAELGALNNLVLQCQQTAEPGVLHLLRQDRTLDLANASICFARLVSVERQLLGPAIQTGKALENHQLVFIISSFYNI